VTKNSEKRVPALRFKGFTNDWEQRKLGEVTQRVQGNDNNMNRPVLTISAKTGWMTQSNRFSSIIAGSEKKKYTLLKKGELSYNHGNSKIAPFGTVFMLNNYSEALVPKVYHSFKANYYMNPYFLELYFHTKKLDPQLRKFISSSARMDGLLNITYKWFEKIFIFSPQLSEQNKLEKIFLLINKYISLQQRKLRQLNFIRQGLTQNLFPDKDKIKPKVQFKGYKENWKITKAKNIFTEVDIRELPDRVILSTTQTGKVVTRSSLGRNLLFSKDKLKNYKLVLPGQFIIHLRSFKGGFATSELSGIVSPTYTIFDFKDRKQNDSNFWSILFTHYNFIQSLKSITEGIRYNGVTIKFNQFADLKITYPDLEIQSRLSQLIQCLDADIKKQKLKIQKFKKVKQFLLQNMFT
jgi:type I restriction enzyme S subunit